MGDPRAAEQSGDQGFEEEVKATRYRSIKNGIVESGNGNSGL
jgi:hypothetical protein